MVARIIPESALSIRICCWGRYLLCLWAYSTFSGAFHLFTEIFQKGLIPSDTDFRIFRDFAKIPGLDMAFVKNGYVYHTKFDNVEHVTSGSIQHEGSNVLELLKSLGDTDFSKAEYTDTKDKTVFFDVFGYFVLVYSENTAIILNIFVGVAVLAIAWKEGKQCQSRNSFLLNSLLIGVFFISSGW